MQPKPAQIEFEREKTPLRGWLKRLSARLRWHPSVITVILAVSLLNAVVYHRPLYRFAMANLELSSASGLLTLVTVFFLVVLFSVLLLSLASVVSQRLIKPFCMLAAFCNAGALYFVETYGVLLDKSMMGNVLNTNVAESTSFVGSRLLLYLLVFGALPVLLLTRIKIRKVPLGRRAVLFVSTLVIGVVWIYAVSFTWLWFDKNSRRLGGLTMPWSYIIGASRNYADRVSASRSQTLLPVARFASNEKTIVVLVIGESARAENFSLYGYKRLTNPTLADSGIVTLAHTRSCATYTTAALMCILSPLDAGWSFSGHEPLPSYLQRSGVDVIWRANNWGEPTIKVQTYERAEDLARSCTGASCSHDEVLLTGLEERVRASTKQKVFVVLHQHGSHGPAYSSEYPTEFEAFKPVCKSVELHECTRDELINAYDNTIRYTDDFLSRTITLLKQFPDAATMLMYISDHGESLGEYGLYLHGTPNSVAPDVQRDVPFLIWMSDTFSKMKGVERAQLASQASHSDANVFPSVMGAFDMQSEIYQPKLDVFHQRQ